MKGVFEKEGVCRSRRGYEEDYLEFEGEGDDMDVGASDLIANPEDPWLSHKYRVKIRVEWERVVE